MTAAGSEGRKSAIAVARAVVFECTDAVLTELGNDYKDEDFLHYLLEEIREGFREECHFLFNECGHLIRFEECQER